MSDHDLNDVMELGYEETRELLSHIDNLWSQPGWHFFVEFLKTRENGLRGQLNNMRVVSLEDVALFNRHQGGLEEVSRIPVILHQVGEDLRLQVKAMQDRMEEDDPNE